MMNTQGAVLGIVFLCSAFAFARALKANKNPSSVVLGAARNKLYKCGLIEVMHPRRDGTRVPQQLLNDDILTKGVREVEQTLYVYVHADTTEPNSNVCEYISSLYSRLWDEMLQAGNLGLKCIVMGNVAGAGFTTLDQLRMLPDLGILYYSSTLSVEDLEALKKKRTAKGFAEIVSVASSSPALAAQVYYFDAMDCDIPRFQRVAVGGTFDQLHNGHKKLLTLAAGCCEENMVIGITGDEMLKKKSNAGMISSYSQRAKNVVDFLQLVKPSLRYEPVEIQDPFGPTITDATIQAIVVSSETVPGANKINQLRSESGMPPLAIFVSRRSEGATLSSTFLRAKQMS